MLTASQCRAARALLDASRETLSRYAGVAVPVIANFEQKIHEPDDATKRQLREALEGAGIRFIPEDGGGGAGVRLKFSRKDMRAIYRWEGEGGVAGDDDV
ncbi:MAG: hypothetical protein NAOJABEB_00367 [Steroidobacteraceae bacterium]|nr:hypothetical protein [Steroidobacteraceae bacterium]